MKRSVLPFRHGSAEFVAKRREEAHCECIEQRATATDPVGAARLAGVTAKLTEGEWTLLPGARPANVNTETVYVLPTHLPPEGDEDERPRYADNVRYLPKEARAAGAPVEFATPEGTRKYVQHFSIDPEMWALGLLLMNLASDWLVFTVEQFINTRAKAQGYTPEEATQLPLKVAIAETSTSRNIEVEGSGADVLEALKLLQQRRIEEGDLRADGE